MASKQTLFNRWAPIYDWPLTSVFYQAVHQRILDYAQIPELANVLDLGCGTGKLLNRLAKAEPTLTGTGLDFSSEMLTQALQKSFDPNRLTYCQGSTDQMPLPDSVFDCAFCSISFLHYPDPIAVLQELRRVLKPGGYFHLADYAPSLWSSQSEQALPMSPNKIKFYSAGARSAMAQQADLNIVSHHYLMGPVMLTIFQKSYFVEDSA